MIDVAAAVERMRLDAARSAAELAGDSSACAMARSGVSFPAYKFHEGRTAALGSVLRGLRRGEAPEQVLAAGLSHWAGEVERWAGAGRDWQAYAAGGLDAVEEATALLSVG